MVFTFVFYLVCVIAGKMGEMTVLMVDKDKNFTAAIGDSVTLECFIRSDFVAKYYWYKEIMGDFPRLVSSFYTFDESAKFYDEFVNNSRFALNAKKEQNHLMIANLQHSDTGTYYCASSFSEKLEFKDGITIIIKGSGLNIPVFIQRPEYYLNQSEGAVRFNCTAHGRAIDQEHGAYQLRTSGKSDPGALYTWKNNTCFYSLPANNLAVDCAVVTCGHFLKLPQKPPGAEGSTLRYSDDPTTNEEGHTNEDVLHYAALRTSMTDRPKRQMGAINEECVYGRVKHNR
ncbi:uncharacterized protein LOC130521991 isoform X5 [Takifugu flavidus]|uniref:uncharacterized protein LOC130521991 isoform X5 n=1 Tax=Takifugu flavidus TaxID=433684 RepID=UPI0025444EB5|nr:uncharacterized protein LOC130521991 isoform X5 [Takifugu flavidus]